MKKRMNSDENQIIPDVGEWNDEDDERRGESPGRLVFSRLWLKINQDFDDKLLNEHVEIDFHNDGVKRTIQLEHTNIRTKIKKVTTISQIFFSVPFDPWSIYFIKLLFVHCFYQSEDQHWSTCIFDIYRSNEIFFILGEIKEIKENNEGKEVNICFRFMDPVWLNVVHKEQHTEL